MTAKLPEAMVGELVVLVGTDEAIRNDRITARVVRPTPAEVSRGIDGPQLAVLGNRRTYSSLLAYGYRLEHEPVEVPGE